RGDRKIRVWIAPGVTGSESRMIEAIRRCGGEVKQVAVRGGCEGVFIMDKRPGEYLIRPRIPGVVGSVVVDIIITDGLPVFDPEPRITAGPALNLDGLQSGGGHFQRLDGIGTTALDHLVIREPVQNFGFMRGRIVAGAAV